MALVSRKKCTQCKKDFHAVNDQTVCNQCLSVTVAYKRKEHFETLDNMTIDERLRKVEEWIYDYRPPKDPYKTKY